MEMADKSSTNDLKILRKKIQSINNFEVSGIAMHFLLIFGVNAIKLASPQFQQVNLNNCSVQQEFEFFFSFDFFFRIQFNPNVINFEKL